MNSSSITGAATPKISVVTVSYNQAQYIGETIESVLRQGYPNCEHIVVDGGSRDHSREVCGRYPHVQFILAAGTTQSEALNIGFQKATGDIIAWVNSDDFYEPGTFHCVARELDPARGRWIVAGAARVVNSEGGFMWLLRNGRVPLFRLLFHQRLVPYNGWTVMPCQPSVFFHRKVLEDVGPLDGKLKYGMDYDFWMRMLMKGYRFHYIRHIFSNYRYHTASISNQGYDKFAGEWREISDRYYRRLPAWKRMLAECWWLYARVECLFVRRHKAAIEHIARRFGHAPDLHPPVARALVVLRAMTIAPWIPVTLAWRAARKPVQPPPPAVPAPLATRP